jgi:SAM-dependent methyltransferase
MSEGRKTRKGFWNSRYEQQLTRWDLGEVSEPVQRLVEGFFPPSGQVLVPGCGRGYEVIWLERRGYRVTAVDFADEAIRFLAEQAAEHRVQPEILQQDIFLLPAQFNSRYDVLLEQTCFCAIDPSLRDDYEQLAYRVLKPGGQLLGVFMEVDAAAADPAYEGPPYHTPLDLVRPHFPVNRWRFEGTEPLPRNPKRPGAEFLARFTRLAQG